MNNQIDVMVSAFEGERGLATALGHKHVTTVRYWRHIGHIPATQSQNPKVLDAVKKAGVTPVASIFLPPELQEEASK